MKKKVKKIVFQILIVYVCLVGALYMAQRSMIYFPSKDKPDITPYEAQGVFEITAETADGLTLSGWMKNPAAGKPLIVFWHGNASALPWTYEKAAPYAQEGYGVLLASYRGYGGNAGKPSEQGFYQDARAWLQKLQELGLSQDNIILYGESIGTGVAVQMATEFPDVKALILESPYTSLPDVAAGTYFFIPVHLLMKDKFDSYAKIKNVKVPLMIIQGLSDRVIRPKFGQKLFDAANEPKDILKLDGYGHNDLPTGVIAEKTRAFISAL